MFLGLTKYWRVYVFKILNKSFIIKTNKDSIIKNFRTNVLIPKWSTFVDSKNINKRKYSLSKQFIKHFSVTKKTLINIFFYYGNPPLIFTGSNTNDVQLIRYKYS